MRKTNAMGDVVLVTGLSGMVGTRLAARLGERYELVDLSLESGVDITQPAAIADAVAEYPCAQALVHLAAFTDVSSAHLQTDDMASPCFRVNVLGTQNVVEVCRRRALPIIHLSTDFVFDGLRQEPYHEGCEMHPIEWYGRTKAFAEQAARAWERATILRIAFPFGQPPLPKDDLVATFRAKLAALQTLTLFEDQWITPTWLDDIADGIGQLLATPAPGELFHLTGSSSLTPYELGQKIAARFGFDPALVVPSSLSEYLKRDPRPRQRSLRMSNKKWMTWAAERGLRAPLGIDSALERLK